MFLKYKMHYFIGLIFMILSLVGENYGTLYAQTSPSLSGPTFSSSPQPTPREPLKQQPIRPKMSHRQPFLPPRPRPTVARALSYFYPGILVFRNGSWEGGDHLLNIGNQIGVYTEVIKPQDDPLKIDSEHFQKIVENIFAQAHISTHTLTTSNKPPLPAFEIRLFIYPVEGGYAACCEGRLFESVTLRRFYLDPNMAFQAITWQRGSLIVAPRMAIISELEKQTSQIARSFVDVYHTFEQALEKSRK